MDIFQKEMCHPVKIKQGFTLDLDKQWVAHPQ